MHYIRYDVLYQAVAGTVQCWAKAITARRRKVLNKIQKGWECRANTGKEKKGKCLEKRTDKMVDRLFTKMYEDRACEKITERETSSCCRGNIKKNR